jgi:hypothetical protein
VILLRHDKKISFFFLSQFSQVIFFFYKKKRKKFFIKFTGQNNFIALMGNKVARPLRAPHATGFRRVNFLKNFFKNFFFFIKENFLTTDLVLASLPVRGAIGKK